MIAHPRSELLIQSPKAGGDRQQLTPIDELDDEAVRAFVRALPADGRPGPLRFAANGEPYLGSVRRIEGAARPRWLVCTFLPEDDVLAAAHRGNRQTLAVCVAVLALLCCAPNVKAA